ncbi:Coenzyme F420 hydrogenase/dehydrogenase, beta subunit C-terminal domain [Pseudahrensia aquimaris]|uniref:Coenzyme F420 hydrogenase/dehydrogenase, beta subunit C-terminal domain n=1 Tax=Pseudahrensia aquimaris TaxID=744461 RepID=A0ABW3FH07_9HYPH
MKDPTLCGSACQFIKPDYPRLEKAAHGRERADNPDPDAAHFGTFTRIVRASLRKPAEGAQWTGLTTRLAERLLEQGKVDCVIAVKPAPEDRWKPEPVIITRAQDMAQCRGMRMGYAPTLALLEPAMEAGHRRIAVVGIPCQVYALRALEEKLGLEALYVIGTPCSDNTTTENFHTFLNLLDGKPESINYLEFRADYQVELRFDDGHKREIPFLKLPISKLPADFFPLTCKTCVDYTNALSDITVGYMGGTGEQWLIVRNQRGEELLEALGDEVKISAPESKGKRQKHVEGFKANVERAAGGLPLRAMPDWVRPIVAWLMPKIGPKGMEFARTRVEMKAIETVLHLRADMPSKMKNMVPEHVWKLAAAYGLKRGDGE